MEAFEIPGYRTGVRVEHGLDADVPCLGCKAQGLHGSVNDGRALNWTYVKAELSHRYARNVEKVFDELRLRPDVAIS